MDKTVLLVEDDAQTRGFLRHALEQEGHRVLEAEGAEQGFQLFVARKPDLVVLDRNLPDGDGVEVCARIRASGARPATPVIILTAKGALEDKVSGLSSGADQYLVKPLHPLEFMVWVRALLRRVEFSESGGTRLTVGHLSLHLETREAWYQAMPLSRLTAKEFELLHYLVKHRDRIVSRKEILSKLWKTVAVDHTVDTHITNLRKKLPTEIADRIQNLRGEGFRYFA